MTTAIRPRLPFAFAQDQRVALDGARLIVGPGATMNGLREAQRYGAAAGSAADDANVKLRVHVSRSFVVTGQRCASGDGSSATACSSHTMNCGWM